MFGEKKEEAKKGKVETILGTGTEVKGDIHTKGSLRIEGKVNGNIKADGDLFIGESGDIQTEIEARKIVIAGKVKGNVIARDKLEILPKGRLEGDIKTAKLKIEEGAIFIGSSETLNGNNTSNKAKKRREKKEKEENKKKNNGKES